MLNILAAEGPSGRWLPSDVNEFYWGAAAFTVIVVLFIWKGLPAVRQMFADQTASVERELAAAAAAKVAPEGITSSTNRTSRLARAAPRRGWGCNAPSRFCTRAALSPDWAGVARRRTRASGQAASPSSRATAWARAADWLNRR